MQQLVKPSIKPSDMCLKLSADFNPLRGKAVYMSESHYVIPAMCQLTLALYPVIIPLLYDDNLQEIALK